MTQWSMSDSAPTQAVRLHAYLSGCADAITDSLNSQSDGQSSRLLDVQTVRQGVSQFREALRRARPLKFQPQSVAVIDSLVKFDSDPELDEFKSISSGLLWKSSFRSDDDGREMALAPMNDVFELGDVTCGFIFVDAGCSYPEHQHEPQELYLTLSGGAHWRFGGSDHYELLDSGRVIYNKPWDLHGVRANQKPCLALYVLWPLTE